MTCSREGRVGAPLRCACSQSVPELLRLGIGYRLQEHKLGGMSRSTRCLLRQVAASAREGSDKAPPRKRPANDPQHALLSGLLADPEGRQMVATYATKRSRRYAYYETRKDLARPDDPPSTRYQQGALDRHIVHQVMTLLDDEHSLRRMADLDGADQLRCLFVGARNLIARINTSSETQAAL